MIARRKSTVKDVAERAGVSPTTVSFVLNGRDAGIPDTTKERVRRAVEELNYHFDYTARAMKTRRTNLIGVVVPDISNAFFASCVHHIQLALSQRGYDILLCNSDEQVQNDLRSIRLLAGRNVDGLIVTPSAEALTEKFEERIRTELDESGLPYLMLDRYFRGDERKITVDNEGSSYALAKYLISCGHKKIGAVTGPLTLNSSSNRLEGLRRALNESGLSLPDEYIFAGKYDIETGIIGGEALLKTDVTAIFAFSDGLALGVYESAKRAGRKIPEDLSVAGFDDAPYSPLLDPPLTTMRQPVKELAEAACRSILSIVEGEEETETGNLAAELLIRGSVRKI